ncbi:MurR/RpiR family transcriptional regulator [Peptacetobacter hominis]|uniref:MurR/RpiR family transcriptional regulator n=1 Tax=Peptacetobacter hominis TaxID=2743610 RepID=A0A544QYB4_9FIRM|nr:MurR/RpiR family transcriptional regulator [Peptacetobacter hominis]TQQ85712.1 MurR/RpiR family transcriptional regulator [Peptacetobacter hominis]
MNEDSVLDRLYKMYDDFYEQEKKVASYIIKNSRKVINMTIGELAKESGVSVATISRICKKCNSGGFHNLKISIAGEIVNSAHGTREIANDITRKNIRGSLNRIAANKAAEIQETIDMIDSNILEKVIDLIEKANIVNFVAVGNTIPVALDGAYRLSEIGIKAVSSPIWETQLAFSMTLEKNDVIVAISNSGESKKVYSMVEQAKKRGVKTIGITNNPDSAIAKISDYHIKTVTKERLFMNEFYFSRVSAMTVIEIIHLILASGEKERYEKVSMCEKMMADEKI